MSDVLDVLNLMPVILVLWTIYLMWLSVPEDVLHDIWISDYFKHEDIDPESLFLLAKTKKKSLASFIVESVLSISSAGDFSVTSKKKFFFLHSYIIHINVQSKRKENCCKFIYNGVLYFILLHVQ